MQRGSLLVRSLVIVSKPLGVDVLVNPHGSRDFRLASLQEGHALV